MNRPNIIKNNITLMALLTIMLPLSSYAQTVPSTADPSKVIRSFEADKQAPSRLEDIVTLGREDIDDEGLSDEKIFTLESVTLEGSTVYSQDDINRIAADYIGKEASFADLNAIAKAVTKQYREDGYIFSSANLPPQTIKGGTIRLEAIEGRITGVNVVGDYTDTSGLIARLAEKIKTAGPTSTKELERYMLLIDDLPGITARSVLKPSSTPGGGDLVITIEQEKYEGSVSIDNRGNKFLGPYRGTLVASANSLFGRHDRTTGRVVLSSSTDELRFADIQHEQPIGSEGLRIRGRAAITNTEPGSTLDALNIEGKSHLFDVEMVYPVLRSRQYNIDIGAGFNALNVQTDTFGTQLSKDQVRSLRIMGELDFSDSLAGINQIALTATKGVDILGASNDGLGRTRINGEHEFLRTNIEASRVQGLFGDFSMLFSVSGQHSSDALLSSEEFSIGGGGFGRAYDAGEITGDKGVAGLVELRYGRSAQSHYVDSYQLFGYWDAGKVWNKNIAVGEVSSASLASAGLGVRANLIYDTFASIELNQPLTRSVGSKGDEDPRIFFNILKRF